ncbi:hypothetical protein [Candidatus Halobonum tyrrellensis]|uniref:Ferrichrome-binding protein n=1 Tax=Candidatus Halobonum tyrrellensis G22 TaxID=1324957 RepID=V4GX42_9EURY|nr:hypothetical protein [Candidatus Halobonum tyrrellensis]ESP89741.1 ferrichrome-binding protein [Candidatus Halobonum tyrrellensis G22]
MNEETTDTGETPTRRDYVKYGGAVVGGGLLAGCTGDSDGGSTPDSTATETQASAETPTEDTSYSVTMEPMGTVEFGEPPETWLAFLSTYGDMGIALGQAGGLRGLWDPETMPTAFYDALPGVNVSFDDVTPIAEGGEFDKEILYELDCDVHLIDPNWLGILANDWSEDDAEEVADIINGDT